MQDRPYAKSGSPGRWSRWLLLACLVAGCGLWSQGAALMEIDVREAMRAFVVRIAEATRAVDPEFVVIPQNGDELLTRDGEPDGPLAADYAAAIDGLGREDLRYGYEEDNVPTPPAARAWMEAFLHRAEGTGIEVLVTDYCWTRAFVDDSYASHTARGYVAFAADRRGLDRIPAYPATPHSGHAGDVEALAEVRNFLYLIDPGAFADRSAFLDALRATDYDLLLIDPCFEGNPLTLAEVASLKTKGSGGRRPVIAYLSIGEAEDYRSYWDPAWHEAAPSWLLDENPDWPGNYKVRYWDPAWQAIILGNETSGLVGILAAGFDGVYLDLIDAHAYFEEKGDK